MTMTRGIQGGIRKHSFTRVNFEIHLFAPWPLLRHTASYPQIIKFWLVFQHCTASLYTILI